MDNNNLQDANIENYEQLKKNMMWIVGTRNEIPHGLEMEIESIFEQLEAIYRDNRCYDSSIRQYMEGNFGELIANFKGQIGTPRREKQLDEIQSLLAEIRQELEEHIDREEQQKRDNRYRDAIVEISVASPNVTLQTMDLIADSLRDIQSRQTRILYARGFSHEQIGEINQETRDFISRILREKYDDRVHEIFKEDTGNMRAELLQAFEEYVAQRVEEEPSKQNTFKDSLFAGISLEQQSANAKLFLDDSKEESQEQGKDETLEGLPEIFLD